MDIIEEIKIEENIYYNYALLDPRKPGYYRYENYEFYHEPFYVGKGKNDRYESTLRDRHKCFKMNEIKKLRKLGLEPIVIVFNKDITEKESLSKEVHLVKLIGRRNIMKGPLTNLTDGGDGSSGRVVTEEFRERYRQLEKERGLLLSYAIGRVVSQKSRDKASNSMKGRKFTEDHKNKLKEASTCKKKVLQYNLKDNLIREWESVAQASNYCNVSKQAISQCCRNCKYNKTAGGFKWKYKNAIS